MGQTVRQVLSCSKRTVLIGQESTHCFSKMTYVAEQDFMQVWSARTPTKGSGQELIQSPS